jgi:Domain of unknown function (DUF4189)
MAWTRRSCFCPTYALVLLLLGVSRAGAWGALAVGASPDNPETAAAVGRATEDEAREAALAACRTAKGGTDQARSLCTVVGTFQNQCFAVAGPAGGPGWSIAADEEAARVEAVAKCMIRARRTARRICRSLARMWENVACICQDLALRRQYTGQPSYIEDQTRTRAGLIS